MRSTTTTGNSSKKCYETIRRCELEIWARYWWRSTVINYQRTRLEFTHISIETDHISVSLEKNLQDVETQYCRVQDKNRRLYSSSRQNISVLVFASFIASHMRSQYENTTQYHERANMTWTRRRLSRSTVLSIKWHLFWSKKCHNIVSESNKHYFWSISGAKCFGLHL